VHAGGRGRWAEAIQYCHINQILYVPPRVLMQPSHWNDNQVGDDRFLFQIVTRELLSPRLISLAGVQLN